MLLCFIDLNAPGEIPNVNYRAKLVNVMCVVCLCRLVNVLSFTVMSCHVALQCLDVTVPVMLPCHVIAFAFLCTALCVNQFSYDSHIFFSG